MEAIYGNEREQIIPLLDKVKLKTLKRDFLHVSESKYWPADKGYDLKQKRVDLRFPSIRPQIPRASLENQEKHLVDQSKSLFLDFSKSAVLLGISENTAVSLSDGNVKKFTLTHSLTLLNAASDW